MAGVLARFHAQAQRVKRSPAPLLVVERQFERNVHELMSWVDARGEVDGVLALERFAHAFVVSHEGEFRARARGACGRDTETCAPRECW